MLKTIVARNPGDAHRAATPLELFFDLVSVIAIAAAAAGLHHAILDDHVVDGLFRYMLMFFGIWWVWVNYTWYASAYDNGDAHYTISVFVMMFGSLFMAAGVDGWFENGSVALPVIGWTIARLSLATLWWRAAKGDAERATTAKRYAMGLFMAQAGWIIAAFVLPAGLQLPAFLALIAVELFIPWFAEQAAPTTWHKHHIIERHGLLNIIVLGELILSAGLAIQEAAHGGHFDYALIPEIIAFTVIACAMWWLYFSEQHHLALENVRTTLIWAYGHWLIYAAGAAAGAGLIVWSELYAGHGKISWQTAAFAIALPAAAYVIGIWFLFDRLVHRGWSALILPFTAVALVVLPFVTTAVWPIALVLSVGLWFKLRVPVTIPRAVEP